jgi:hypothetical protein
MFAQPALGSLLHVTHFHQWPFWNPYKCGAMPMLGNPESGIVTPFLLFYLILGLIPGMLLDEIYLHVAIMFAGGYVFGRELGLVPLAALVLAAMFAVEFLAIAPCCSWSPQLSFRRVHSVDPGAAARGRAGCGNDAEVYSDRDGQCARQKSYDQREYQVTRQYAIVVRAANPPVMPSAAISDTE